jgi:hypothetical protein
LRLSPRIGWARYDLIQLHSADIDRRKWESTMSGRRDSAQRALNASASFLHHSHHTAILDALDAEGLLDGEEKRPNGGPVRAVADDVAPKRPVLTLMQAAAAKQENRALVQQVCATAARMGLTSIDPNERIDVNKLNLELSGRSIDERMHLKGMLSRLHTIA